MVDAGVSEICSNYDSPEFGVLILYILLFIFAILSDFIRGDWCHFQLKLSLDAHLILMRVLSRYSNSSPCIAPLKKWQYWLKHFSSLGRAALLPNVPNKLAVVSLEWLFNYIRSTGRAGQFVFGCNGLSSYLPTVDNSDSGFFWTDGTT